MGLSLDWVSGGELLEYQRQNHVFSGTAGFSAIKMNMNGGAIRKESRRRVSVRIYFRSWELSPYLAERSVRKKTDSVGTGLPF